MGYYLGIVSLTGERKEGKLLGRLAQLGARLHLHDEQGHGFAAGKFVIRLDDHVAELLPMEDDDERGWGFRGYMLRVDESGTTLKSVDETEAKYWPNRSDLNLDDLPEYPRIRWGGDLLFGIASLKVVPVTEGNKDRREVATARLSWGINEDEYLVYLRSLLSLCEGLGLQLIDDQQGFGVITNGNLEYAVQNYSDCASVIRRVLDTMRDD